MKRVLCIAMAAVLLLTAIPMGVSSEEELPLLIVPVEEEAPAVPAAEAPSTPAAEAPSTPAAEAPSAPAAEAPSAPAADPEAAANQADTAPASAEAVLDSVPATPVEPTKTEKAADPAPASDVPAADVPAEENVLQIIEEEPVLAVEDERANTLSLTVSDSAPQPNQPYTLRFSAPEADEAVLYADGEEIFRSFGGDASLTQTQTEEIAVTYLLRARFGEEWVASRSVTVRVTAAQAEPAADEPGEKKAAETGGQQPADEPAGDAEMDTIEIEISSEPVSAASLRAKDAPDGAIPLNAPRLEVTSKLLAKGASAQCIVHVVENATKYLVEIVNAAGQSVGTSSASKTSDFKIAINSSILKAGKYTVCVTATGEGYADATSEISFRVAQVTLSASASQVAVGSKLTFTLGAAEATSASLLRTSEEGGDPETVQTWTGDMPATFTVQPDAPGVFSYALKATYDEGTLSSGAAQVTVTESMPRVTLNASATTVETGTAYTLTGTAAEADSYVLYENGVAVENKDEGQWQFTHYTPGKYMYRLEADFDGKTESAETAVTVTAGKGKLTPAVITMAKSFTLTEEIRMSFATVTNATSYLMVLYNAAGKALARSEVAKAGTFRLANAGQLSEGAYRIAVTVRAAGYEEAVSEAGFTVVKQKDTLNDPEVNVSPLVLAAGTQVQCSVAAVENATAYVCQLLDAGGNALLTKNIDSPEGFTVRMDTVNLKEGQYTVRITASAEGYSESTAEASFRVVENTLTASSASVETGETFTLTAQVKNADSYILYEDGVQVGTEKDGGTWQLVQYATGRHTYRLEALYGEEKQTLETAVTVMASKGKLTAPSVAVSASFSSTDEMSLSVAPVTNAEIYLVAVYNDEDELVYRSQSDKPGTFRLDGYGGELAGGTYLAVVTVGAAGYEEASTEKIFTVVRTEPALANPVVKVSPLAVTAGTQVQCSVTAVENATKYTCQLLNSGDDEILTRNFDTAEDFTFNIDTADLEEDSYTVLVIASAEGYTEGMAEVYFQVVEITLTADVEEAALGEEFILTATAENAETIRLYRVAADQDVLVSEEHGGRMVETIEAEETGSQSYYAQGEYGDAWVKSNVVTVTVTDSGSSVALTASPTAVETGAAFTLTAQAEEADSYILYENGVQAGTEKDGGTWQFVKYAAGQYVYRLEALCGGKKQTAEARVTVTASKGKLEAPAVTVSETIALTEEVRMSFTGVDNAESYLITMHNAEGKLLARSQVAKAGTYRLGSGSTLGEGAYRVTVTAQAAGYDAGQTVKSFTVGQAASGTVILTSGKTAVTTMESYVLTITAAGASAMQVTGVNEDEDIVYSYSWSEGGTQTVSVATGMVGKVTYTPRALFGTNWVTGASVSVQVSATRGNLAAPTVNYPYQVASGQAVNVTYTAVPNAVSYALRMINVVTGEIADATVHTAVSAWTVAGLPDGHYRVEVEAQAAGYNAGLCRGSLHVGEIDRTVTLSAASASIAAGQPIELTINAPHADELKLYVKIDSEAEILEDIFDYTTHYTYTPDATSTVALRVEGLINNTWLTSNTVTVQIAGSASALTAPVIDAPTLTRKGDKLIFTVSKPDNATDLTVTIGLKSSSSTATNVFSGAAASKTFKVDTSRMQEGLYVITATVSATGFTGASATAEVYIGTQSSATSTATSGKTPTPTPASTAKTATPKPTSTKKSSSSSSSSKKSTATPKATPTVTPTVTATSTLMLPIDGQDSLLAQHGLLPTGSPQSQGALMLDDEISFRAAENFTETYDMDVGAELEATYAIFNMINGLEETESIDEAQVTILHAEDLLTEEEMEEFEELDIANRFLLMLYLVGGDEIAEQMIDERLEEFVDADNLCAEIEARVRNSTAEERAKREQIIQTEFRCPSTRGGENAICISVSIFKGFSTRYEMYAFCQAEDGWILDQIYIGTSLEV